MRFNLGFVVSIFAALLVWKVVVMFHFFSPLLVPAPSEVLFSAYNILTTQESLFHIGSTSLRFSVGLLLGVLGGLIIGFMLVFFRSLKKIVLPWVDFLRSIPQAVFIPLFLLFWGVGETSRIVLITLTVALIMIVSVVGAYDSSSALRRIAAASFGFSKFDMFLKVLLPEALPHLSSGFKLSISFAFIIAIVSEMFVGTTYGMGHAIVNAQLTYETATMYGYIIISGSMGYILNTVYNLVEKRYIHWAGK